MTDHVRSGLLAAVPHGFSTKAGIDGFAGLPNRPLIRVRQVHSTDVITVSDSLAWPGNNLPEADALVTNMPGCLLAVVTADCAPVLLADMKVGVVGAAHAGWRGAVGGVLENTIVAMEALGANRANIAAVIGPCIAQANYEVDSAFKTQFCDADASFFVEGRRDHWHFDLPAYSTHRLKQADIGYIDDARLDTYADDDRFYSYRRATHRKEPTEGRQISVIGLPDQLT